MWGTVSCQMEGGHRNTSGDTLTSWLEDGLLCPLIHCCCHLKSQALPLTLTVNIFSSAWVKKMLETSFILDSQTGGEFVKWERWGRLGRLCSGPCFLSEHSREGEWGPSSPCFVDVLFHNINRRDIFQKLLTLPLIGYNNFQLISVCLNEGVEANMMNF